MIRAEIRLFGSLGISCDGQPIASLQGRKCRDLLGYLVLRHDRAHSREHLAELFWGQRDDTHARHCFNTALWRLQAALGGKDGPAKRWLRIDSQTVSFCTDPVVSVDVIEFETRCALADGWPASETDQQAALRRQAVAVYRGDLLADCYEEWCLADRERLQRLYVRALRRLVQYHRQRGEFDPAIDEARRILACDPLREEVHRDLIRLYIAAGQPAAALQQYRTCFEVLQRELGTAPMSETSLLVQPILQAGRQETTPHAKPVYIPAGGQEGTTPPAATDPHLASLEAVLQVCHQLREIVTSLEAVVTRLTQYRPEPLGHSTPPAGDHRHRQVLPQLPSGGECGATAPADRLRLVSGRSSRA